MNRRRFLAAISVLPLLGWLKPKPDNLHAILSIRGKEYALGIKLSDDDRVNRDNIRLLADSMRETAYEKLGLDEYNTKREKLAEVDPYWYLYE